MEKYSQKLLYSIDVLTMQTTNFKVLCWHFNVTILSAATQVWHNFCYTDIAIDKIQSMQVF